MKSWMIGFVSMVMFTAAPMALAQKETPGPKSPVQTTGRDKEKDKDKKVTAPPKENPSKTLDAVESAEVQAYADSLKSAGLPPQDVKSLVDLETKERLDAKKRAKVNVAHGKAKDAAPAKSTPRPSTPQDPPMGAFVRGLLDRGMRGNELADAIHAEQKRRDSAARTPAPAPAPGHTTTGFHVKPKQGQAPKKGKPAGHPKAKPQAKPEAKHPAAPKGEDEPAEDEEDESSSSDLGGREPLL
jgi:hypothetical protein